jgi:hypothetical protein
MSHQWLNLTRHEGWFHFLANAVLELVTCALPETLMRVCQRRGGQEDEPLAHTASHEVGGLLLPLTSEVSPDSPQ